MSADPIRRLRAWLVTGPLGRGAAFAIDFAVAIGSRNRSDGPPKR